MRDEATEIEFAAPGREDVFAEFNVDEAMPDEIRGATAGGDKLSARMQTVVTTRSATVIARLRKQSHMPRKPGHAARREWRHRMHRQMRTGSRSADERCTPAPADASAACRKG